MSSERAYGSVALWAFIGLFYALMMVGRADNFLVDDMYLLEEGCIREFYRLKQANALNLDERDASVSRREFDSRGGSIRGRTHAVGHQDRLGRWNHAAFR